MGATSNHCVINNKGNLCHCFIAIDPACFGDPKAIKEHFSRYLQELRDSPVAEGAERIYTHGEKEAKAVEERTRTGIPVNDKTLDEFRNLCDYLNMDYDVYFGKKTIAE